MKYNRLGLISFLSLFIFACICPCTWFDPRNYSSGGNNPNPQIELLKSYVSEGVLSKANPDYYAYFGFRDWWRFPLVYPYSIHTIDVIDYGCLYNEYYVKDYEDPNNQKLIDMDICGITHLNLDQNYLLLRVNNNGRFREENELRKKEFILFKFKTGSKEAFASEDELLARAKELGFSGKLELMTLQVYDDLFWE